METKVKQYSFQSIRDVSISIRKVTQSIINVSLSIIKVP